MTFLEEECNQLSAVSVSSARETYEEECRGSKNLEIIFLIVEGGIQSAYASPRCTTCTTSLFPYTLNLLTKTCWCIFLCCGDSLPDSLTLTLAVRQFSSTSPHLLEPLPAPTLIKFYLQSIPNTVPMAAYASYRHIELDKIGNGKKRISLNTPTNNKTNNGTRNEPNKATPNNRITRPPGGESSDIFGSSPSSTPPGTPRKVKNYMASTIFTPESQGQQQPQQLKVRQRPENDSFNRLFGANGDAVDGATTPRGKNQPKGNIAGIFNDEIGVNGRANGHTTNGQANGHGNGQTNGHTTNGHTNGHSNGTNGHSNGNENGNGSISSGASSTGSVTPNGSINGDAKSNGHSQGIPLTPTRRVPPGGYSSKLW